MARRYRRPGVIPYAQEFGVATPVNAEGQPDPFAALHAYQDAASRPQREALARTQALLQGDREFEEYLLGKRKVLHGLQMDERMMKLRERELGNAEQQQAFENAYGMYSDDRNLAMDERELVAAEQELAGDLAQAEWERQNGIVGTRQIPGLAQPQAGDLNAGEFFQLQQQLMEPEQTASETTSDLSNMVQPPNAMQRATGRAMEAAANQFARKNVAAYLEVSKVLNDPHTPAHVKEDVKRQFMMQHPNMPKPQPLTEEQYREIQTQQKLAEYKEQMGPDAPPLFMNKDGEPEVVKGFTEHLKARTAQMKELKASGQAETPDEIYKREMERHKLSEPVPPKGKDDQGYSQSKYNQDRRAWVKKAEEIFDRAHGRAPGGEPQPTATPPQDVDIGELREGLKAKRWPGGTQIMFNGKIETVSDDGQHLL